MHQEDYNFLPLKKIKTLLKKIPGIKWLYRTFINTPGSWIYTNKNLKWLTVSENYILLPLLYKIFSLYCKYAPRYKKRVIGAEIIHLFISRITRLFHLKDNCCIQIGNCKIFLLLTDPRSILIPNEIKSSPEISQLFNFLTEGDTFVDIGANHGSFSVVASKIVGSSGHIIAIEPQPRLAKLVNQSLSINNCQSYEVHQVACSNKNGEATFFIPLASSGSAGIFKDLSAISAAEKFTTKLVKFDDLIDTNSLKGNIFFKLDIEGSEINFIQGAFNCISKIQPKIMMEINPSSIRAANTKENELVSILQDLGYYEYFEIEDSKRFSLKKLNFSKQRNIIIIPNNTSN